MLAINLVLSFAARLGQNYNGNDTKDKEEQARGPFHPFFLSSFTHLNALSWLKMFQISLTKVYFIVLFLLIRIERALEP